MDAAKAALGQIVLRRKRQAMYHKVVVRCCEEIKQISTKQTSIIYTVPTSFMSDVELYSQLDARDYLADALRRMGFEVVVIDSERVYASWTKFAERVAGEVLGPEAFGVAQFDADRAMERIRRDSATKVRPPENSSDAASPALREIDAFLDSVEIAKPKATRRRKS